MLLTNNFIMVSSYWNWPPVFLGDTTPNQNDQNQFQPRSKPSCPSCGQRLEVSTHFPTHQEEPGNFKTS